MGSPCCPSCCFHLIQYSLSGEGTRPCLLCSLFHRPPQGCPRSDRNSTWLEGPREGEDSGIRLVSRVAPRTLGYRDPKGMAGGGSAQVPAPQPHAMGGLGTFPQLGLSLWLPKVRTQPSLCFQHLLDVMRAKPRPSCHLVRWAGPRTGWVESRASGLGSATDRRVTLDKSRSSAFQIGRAHV